MIRIAPERGGVEKVAVEHNEEKEKGGKMKIWRQGMKRQEEPKEN